MARGPHPRIPSFLIFARPRVIVGVKVCHSTRVSSEPCTATTAGCRPRQDPVNAVTVPHGVTYCDLLPPMAVEVRVEWPGKGVEHVRAFATAWTPELVRCDWPEPRLPQQGVWFPTTDIRRI